MSSEDDSPVKSMTPSPEFGGGFRDGSDNKHDGPPVDESDSFLDDFDPSDLEQTLGQDTSAWLNETQSALSPDLAPTNETTAELSSNSFEFATPQGGGWSGSKSQRHESASRSLEKSNVRARLAFEETNNSETSSSGSSPDVSPVRVAHTHVLQSPGQLFTEPPETPAGFRDLGVGPGEWAEQAMMHFGENGENARTPPQVEDSASDEISTLRHDVARFADGATGSGVFGGGAKNKDKAVGAGGETHRTTTNTLRQSNETKYPGNELSTDAFAAAGAEFEICELKRAVQKLALQESGREYQSTEDKEEEGVQEVDDSTDDEVAVVKKEQVVVKQQEVDDDNEEEEIVEEEDVFEEEDTFEERDAFEEEDVFEEEDTFEGEIGHPAPVPEDNGKAVPKVAPEPRFKTASQLLDDGAESKIDSVETEPARLKTETAARRDRRDDAIEAESTEAARKAAYAAQEAAYAAENEAAAHEQALERERETQALAVMEKEAQAAEATDRAMLAAAARKRYAVAAAAAAAERAAASEKADAKKADAERAAAAKAADERADDARAAAAKTADERAYFERAADAAAARRSTPTTTGRALTSASPNASVEETGTATSYAGSVSWEHEKLEASDEGEASPLCEEGEAPPSVIAPVTVSPNLATKQALARVKMTQTRRRELLLRETLLEREAVVAELAKRRVAAEGHRRDEQPERSHRQPTSPSPSSLALTHQLETPTSTTTRLGSARRVSARGDAVARSSADALEQANAKRLQRLLAAEAEFESATKPGRNRFGRSSLTPPSAGLLANTDSNSPGYLRSIASPATSGVRLNAHTKRSARAATQFGSPLSNSPSSSASPVHGSPQIRRPWGFHAPEEANAAAARRAATPMKSPHRAYSGTPVRLNAHTKRPSAAERLPDSTSRRPLSSLAKYTDKDVSRRPLSSRSNYDSKERVSSSGRKSDLRNGSLKKKTTPSPLFASRASVMTQSLSRLALASGAADTILDDGVSVLLSLQQTGFDLDELESVWTTSPSTLGGGDTNGNDDDEITSKTPTLSVSEGKRTQHASNRYDSSGTPKEQKASSPWGNGSDSTPLSEFERRFMASYRKGSSNSPLSVTKSSPLSQVSKSASRATTEAAKRAADLALGALGGDDDDFETFFAKYTCDREMESRKGCASLVVNGKAPPETPETPAVSYARQCQNNAPDSDPKMSAAVRRAAANAALAASPGKTVQAVKAAAAAVRTSGKSRLASW